MAPAPLRVALPVRLVRSSSVSRPGSSRNVRVRANADELSRIAEIEEEIARQVSPLLRRVAGCDPFVVPCSRPVVCWALVRLYRRTADSQRARSLGLPLVAATLINSASK